MRETDPYPLTRSNAARTPKRPSDPFRGCEDRSLFNPLGADPHLPAFSDVSCRVWDPYSEGTVVGPGPLGVPPLFRGLLKAGRPQTIRQTPSQLED